MWHGKWSLYTTTVTPLGVLASSIFIFDTLGCSSFDTPGCCTSTQWVLQQPMRVLLQHTNLWPPSHMPWITAIFWLKQFHKMQQTFVIHVQLKIDE